MQDEPGPKKVKAPPAQTCKVPGKESCTVEPATTPCKLGGTSLDCVLLRSNRPVTADGRLQPAIEWPMFRYNPVNEAWQRETCTRMGLTYRHANRFGAGGPDEILTRPHRSRNVVGDGNHLFRAFAKIITGSEQDHYAVRFSILSYMITLGHLLLGHHLARDDASVHEYRRIWLISACAYISTARKVGLIIQDALNKQVQLSGCGLIGYCLAPGVK